MLMFQVVFNSLLEPQIKTRPLKEMLIYSLNYILCLREMLSLVMTNTFITTCFNVLPFKIYCDLFTMNLQVPQSVCHMERA